MGVVKKGGTLDVYDYAGSPFVGWQCVPCSTSQPLLDIPFKSCFPAISLYWEYLQQILKDQTNHKIRVLYQIPLFPNLVKGP